ncbi:hypothetical protein B5M42_023020 [Paenibacillus athensensis]|nr:hypothetical protein [Paenibacillus athensensis]
MEITFIRQDNSTKVIESFEAEGMNAVEMQQAGWQAILNNFKLMPSGLQQSKFYLQTNQARADVVGVRLIFCLGA